jgi:putative DNA primase/helicase
MSDAQHIKRLLRERVAELAPYLFPSGKREGNHWSVGDISGSPGKSFKICIGGDKAGLWGDFVDSQKHSRSLLDLWMRARNVDFKTALREAAQWTGQSLSGSQGATAATRIRPVAGREKRSNAQFDWQSCVEAFTPEHLERLATWRGYSIEFCTSLKQNALVGLYEGHLAFPLHDRAGNVVAVHYRLKDRSWRYYPQGATVRPFVIGELIAGESIHVFESQWDAFAFMDVSGERTGVIVTRGASNGAFVSGPIPENSSAYVWTQNDAAGEKWQHDICANTKAWVKWAKIPAPYKDLNDWTRAGATADDLLAAMGNAEVVREAEQSWKDALNAAIVTSSELHDLELIRRKKLLGDWFCEGDLGFIFAFRGVGKTWLALGIAQAVSVGWKLGDWQAHERVKVLYVDGEMPPDLMRDRCEGLKASNANLEFLNHAILFERTGKVLNITKPEVQQGITQHCVNTGVKVLILDNLSTLASGMRENEADSWELVNNWLLYLRRRKIAVIIVHHAGRSGEMRGTSKREDNVFWIIALDDAKKNTDDKRGARFISRFTKPSRNTQEEVPAYEWHFVTDEATRVVSVAHKQAQTMDVFLGLIEDGVTECGQIAEEMKVSPATISRLSKKAIDAGKIVKAGREYVLTEGEETAKKL